MALTTFVKILQRAHLEGSIRVQHLFYVGF